MRRMNRRRFTWMATGGVASAALVACGSDAVDEDLTPTQIPDVAGAPPTLAPQATPFESPEEATPAAEASPAGGGDATPVEEEAPAEEEAAAGGGGEAITVAGLDTFAFDPSAFEASPGQTILFINEGVLQHDFNIDELDLHTALLNSGEEEEVTVPDDVEAGTEYVFYCSVPGHREGGMEGTMTVV